MLKIDQSDSILQAIRKAVSEDRISTKIRNSHLL